MSEYTFDINTFSDLYKDTYGFRPRGHRFYNPETTDEDRQQIWDQLLREFDLEMQRYQDIQNKSIDRFEKLVQDTIQLGAGCRETAIRWITDSFDGYDRNGGHISWFYNLPYSPYREEIDTAIG